MTTPDPHAQRLRDVQVAGAPSSQPTASAEPEVLSIGEGASCEARADAHGHTLAVLEHRLVACMTIALEISGTPPSAEQSETVGVEVAGLSQLMERNEQDALAAIARADNLREQLALLHGRVGTL